MAKVFGAEQGHKFVNGVLDQVARKVRAVEMDAKSKG
ncbi:MAG: transcription antitermination factor NusB [Candidatus Thiodiazotropha taylori]